VPFVAARLSNGTWLVRNADIATVGNPRGGATSAAT
jgi:hypothetical protein